MEDNKKANINDSELENVSGGFEPAKAYTFDYEDCFLSNDNMTIYVFTEHTVSYLGHTVITFDTYYKYEPHTYYSYDGTKNIRADVVAGMRYLGTISQCPLELRK